MCTCLLNTKSDEKNETDRVAKSIHDLRMTQGSSVDRVNVTYDESPYVIWEDQDVAVLYKPAGMPVDSGCECVSVCVCGETNTHTHTHTHKKSNSKSKADSKHTRTHTHKETMTEWAEKSLKCTT
eukprot:GHVR01007906.1.p1 GENE.GHVR01007906.1~~GHVR01007906.1.p1  ORF type:complete len:125 (-),score=56.67 GHVR01007906.1:17-391(-)